MIRAAWVGQSLLTLRWVEALPTCPVAGPYDSQPLSGVAGQERSACPIRRQAYGRLSPATIQATGQSLR